MAQPIHSDLRPTVRPAYKTSSPPYQAYQILHWGFTIAPLVAGIDKFTHFLVNWDRYLAPIIPQTLHIAPSLFMLIVGVIEIVAGIFVAFKPRIGAYLAAFWLVGIILNLLILPGYYDIALRDFGLFLGALALGKLSQEYDRGRFSGRPDAPILP
jgi:uncharacterized membrane protein YphA (DoxX/SURF4 family)